MRRLPPRIHLEMNERRLWLDKKDWVEIHDILRTGLFMAAKWQGLVLAKDGREQDR